VTFHGDAGQVIGALQSHFAAVALADRNVVVVTTEKHLVAQAIFDVGSTGVRIADIAIEKPTLEDVFLQIARGTISVA